jgi:hypothetical protein
MDIYGLGLLQKSGKVCGVTVKKVSFRILLIMKINVDLELIFCVFIFCILT